MHGRWENKKRATSSIEKCVVFHNLHAIGRQYQRYSCYDCSHWWIWEWAKRLEHFFEKEHARLGHLVDVVGGRRCNRMTRSLTWSTVCTVLRDITELLSIQPRQSTSPTGTATRVPQGNFYIMVSNFISNANLNIKLNIRSYLTITLFQNMQNCREIFTCNT